MKSNYTMISDNSFIGEMQGISETSVLGGHAFIQTNKLEIVNTVFSGGVALKGGAVYFSPTGIANMHLSNCIFSKN